MSAFEAVVVGDAQVVQKFDRMPAALEKELQIGIGRSVLIVQRESKENKLSGQVLNVRTGRLRRSITTRVDTSAGEVTGTVGTNVSYARRHEFGFHGSETVREHLRRSKLGRQFSVRSHERKVDVPERSFLRSALRDKKPEVIAQLRAATSRAIA